MDMTKEAIEKLVSLADAEANVTNVDGLNYHKGTLSLLPLPSARALKVASLTAIVDYITGNIDKLETSDLIIHVASPTCVRLYSNIDLTYRDRECYMEATYQPPKLDGSLDLWEDPEDFNILLQAGFVPSQDREHLLKIVGNIFSDAVRNTTDDGVSQAVTVKMGARSAETLVPNPVRLSPYSTFTEVEQVERPFVFRMKTGPNCRLFAADGGAWENEAMKRIADYLNAALENKVLVVR